MTALLIKKRARKSLGVSKVQVAIYPHGVGGIDGKAPVVVLEIGEYRMCIPVKEWQEIVEQTERLKKDPHVLRATGE